MCICVRACVHVSVGRVGILCVCVHAIVNCVHMCKYPGRDCSPLHIYICTLLSLLFLPSISLLCSFTTTLVHLFSDLDRYIFTLLSPLARLLFPVNDDPQLNTLKEDNLKLAITTHTLSIGGRFNDAAWISLVVEKCCIVWVNV